MKIYTGNSKVTKIFQMGHSVLLSDDNTRLQKENAELRECLCEAVRDRCHACTASDDDRRELCDQCIVASWKEAIVKVSGEEVK